MHPKVQSAPREASNRTHGHGHDIADFDGLFDHERLPVADAVQVAVEACDRAQSLANLPFESRIYARCYTSHNRQRIDAYDREDWCVSVFLLQ
jgi:hypothetical protein